MPQHLYAFLKVGFGFSACLFLLIISANAQEAELDEKNQVTAASETDAGVSLEFLESGKAPTSIDQLRAMERKVAEVFELVKPATVNIQLDGAQGTGVVVSRDGYILTAAHVITGPHHIATITFPDGTKTTAQTLGVNPPVDSGMLKIIGDEKWPYLDLGESEPLNSGQWVVAIGHPGGIDMKRGLVVRVGRIIFKSDRVLRTDCTLVGGDSGGPLVDMNGYLIGIHSRIGNSLNDNLHVPVDVYSEEWDKLASREIVGREAQSYIGINVVDDTNEIESVNPGGPADEATLIKGDKIIKIGDKTIEDKGDIGSAFRKLKPDDKVAIVVKRKDEEKSLEIIVGRK